MTATADAKRLTNNFGKFWESATDDNDLTLHGFRRFRTTHLLNLRILEDEIAELDHDIYQAGLRSGLDPAPTDKLGLKYVKRDPEFPEIGEVINRELVLKLRELLRQYDEALVAFNNIMTMETFSLLDDAKQSSLRTDLTLPGIYKTRLLRVDLGSRSRTDPIQLWLHQCLRVFRYWRLSKKQRPQRSSPEEQEPPNPIGRGHRWSHQNNILIANIAGRIITAALTVAFLVAPFATLPHSSSLGGSQLVVISGWIAAFSILVAVILRISNLEVMVVSAAYTAVLLAFMSNIC